MATPLAGQQCRGHGQHDQPAVGRTEQDEDGEEERGRRRHPERDEDQVTGEIIAEIAEKLERWKATR